jgi:hypothetical protein
LFEARRAVALERAYKRFSASRPFFAAADRQNIPSRGPVPENIPCSSPPLSFAPESTADKESHAIPVMQALSFNQSASK